MANIPKKYRIKWTKKQLELLGKMSDSDLGNLLGCHSGTVGRKRNSLGIEKFVDRLSIETDGCPKEISDLLGQIQDAEIARRFNLPYSRIRNWRIRRNIVDVNHQIWTKKFESMLGQMYDGDLAKKMGIHPKRVRKYRRRLGIEPFGSSHPNWKSKSKPKSSKRKTKNEDWKTAMALIDDGYSAKQIAELMGCTVQTVYRHWNLSKLLKKESQ